MIRKLLSLVLQKGARARFQGRPVVIEAILDLNLALVRDLATEQVEQVKIQHLAHLPQTETSREAPAVETEESQEVADKRMEIIKPLLEKSDRTRANVIARAAETGYDPSTLYNWIRIAEQHDDLSKKQRKDKGKSRLDEKVEVLISKTFEELTPLDRSAKQLHEKVKDKIETANTRELENFKNQSRKGSSQEPRGLKVPSLDTIKNRWAEISARAKLARLRGRQAAQQEFDPALGSLPNADFPFAVWQIDHVLLDILIVDDIERKPICRPWLTIAIDPCCRTAPGFEYSLDPPGEMSTGICIGHAILPKEEWLAEIGSTGEWPIWGMPGAIHGDNAFRLKLLKKFCKKHGIDIIWRPVKNPRFGGTIERFVRTLGEKIHYLPGTTLSDPKAREAYDPEAQAYMTESEFLQWLVEQILLYHAEVHSALGMPPMAYFRQAVLKGTATHPPTGLQRRIVDPNEQRRLQLDLMPYVECTVQRNYGVVIDKITYWHDCLRRWIAAKDPEHPKRKRKFMFRRFKRGLKSIWFYDPDLDEYYEIPTRDPSFPDISIWELKKIRAHAKSEGIANKQVDEVYIKARYAKMRQIEDQATTKTKAARKNAQRRKKWNSAPRPSPPSTPAPVPGSDVSVNDDYERVEGFTEDD
jgi:putative transposase